MQTFSSELDPSHLLCKLELRSNQPHDGKEDATDDNWMDVRWKTRIKQAAGALYWHAFGCNLRKKETWIKKSIFSRECYKTSHESTATEHPT